MGSITLIRHGQASFGAADYDQLSALGVAQAEALGRWWKQTAAPSTWWSGSMKRHQQTAAACADALGHAGSVNIDAGFNEFDHQEVLLRFRPEFADTQILASRLATSSSPRRAFQELFAEACSRWMSGQHDADYRESWTVFVQRVMAALQRVMASPGRQHAVFTSGGTIAAVMQEVLHISDVHIMSLNWTLNNAGVSQVFYSHGRLGLSCLNTTSHLEICSDPQLLTYR
ncbi:MAG: histidine phosphatase family protein [Pseudomonadales bacterium]|nr:histidine phosphatase family protein [Pseudomonadales bacterium]